MDITNSINEYILWLEKFREYYSKYLNSSKELREIFGKTIEKFMKILLDKNKTSTEEEDIIKLLKELVKNFSIEYKKNSSINKSAIGPRNTNAFKQNIYKIEISKLKELLSENLSEFSNFESIVMFVAKKRQMIEFLKLGIAESSFLNSQVDFDIFGKRRIPNDNLLSKLIPSHAEHLYKEFLKKNIFDKDIQYIYDKESIPLTLYLTMDNKPEWNHTDAEYHPKLFQRMNELYSDLLIDGNNTSKRNKLAELYWLYIQTCPFERGSASIGEITFSVLLKKFFNCDFFISNGWNGNPEIIPDIYALMYDLYDFKKIFWDQFTNINKNKAMNFRKKIIGQ